MKERPGSPGLSALSMIGGALVSPHHYAHAVVEGIFWRRGVLIRRPFGFSHFWHIACFSLSHHVPSEKNMMEKTSNARWVQLVLGLIVMMAISSPQYVWTLFVKPLQGATGASLPALQITFSML